MILPQVPPPLGEVSAELTEEVLLDGSAAILSASPRPPVDPSERTPSVARGDTSPYGGGTPA